MDEVEWGEEFDVETSLMGKRTWLEHLIDNSYLPAIAKLPNTPEGRKEAQYWADWMKRQWSMGRAWTEIAQTAAVLDG